MATRVKKRTDTATNRESDKIIVRLPEGMRAHIAEMAARRGKSMNAEVVTALAVYIAHDGEPDARTIKNALAEMRQEIQYLRETLGKGGYTTPQPAKESDGIRSLKEEAAKMQIEAASSLLGNPMAPETSVADAVSARLRTVAVERQTKKKPAG
jgi:hypothetical protein